MRMPLVSDDVDCQPVLVLRVKCNEEVLRLDILKIV